MAAGLEVTNANGVIQVTSDYKNLQYVGKGTVSFSNHLASSLVGDYGEVVAFKVNDPSQWGLTPGRIYSGMSNTTFLSQANSSASITYYRFKFSNISAGNYFEVYNPSGERCFSDASRFMKVIGFTEGTYANPVTFSHGYGNNAAVIVGKISSSYNPLGSFVVPALHLYNFSSGLITMQNQYVANGYIPMPYRDYKYYYFLVIDVTGL